MTTRTLRHDPRQRGLSLVLAAIFTAGVLTTAVASVQLLAALGAGGSPSMPPAPPNTPTTAPSPSPSPTAAPTPTPSPSPTPTASPTPTPSPSPTPTASPTAIPAPTPQPTIAPSVAPTVAPTPVPTVAPRPSAAPQPGGALPVCRYDDILTARRGYGDWATTLLDTIYMLPADYYPGDLVDISAAGLTGGYKLRSLVMADLRALSDAARGAGVPIAVVSGFRSYQQQQATFNHWVSVVGHAQALRVSARPGHSEHQLGTVLDFATPGGAAPWEYADWASTPTGGWLAANAWRYGFVMTYPRGRSAVTCYDYEPWHYRYVGRDVAAAITASGLTSREFFWSLGR